MIPSSEDRLINAGPLAAGARRCDDRYLIWLGRRQPDGVSIAEWMMPPPAAGESPLSLENPVFQHAFARTLTAASELLLVGQAGKRHFSAVLQLTADGAAIDVADQWTIPLAVKHVALSFRWNGRDGNRFVAADNELRVGGATDANGWCIRSRFEPPDDHIGLSLERETDSRIRGIAALGGLEQPPRTARYGLEFSLIARRKS